MKAVYAASLDPITNGHINVVERAAPLFESLVVVVAVDSRKQYTFSPEERVAMARESVAHLPNVSVEVCVGTYVVKYAHSIGAKVIVRGMRNGKDLEDELVLAIENRGICPDIETIWIPCLPDLMHVSSSMVKGHVGVDESWTLQVARSAPAHVVCKLKEKYMINKARNYWSALMKALGSPKGSDEIFADLIARYSEEHRDYHTLEHIVRMLDEFEDVRHLASDLNAVSLAIWFHDVVYDVGTKSSKIASNEERSAHLARVALEKLGSSEALVAKVERMILATLHHDASDDFDEKLVLDLDMAILGASADDFDSYEAGIRKEYSYVSPEAFALGRSKFLRSLLDRSEIYASEFFHDRYDKSARENLERALARL
jgi:pantetheine-phosphate adenylyltransferase